MFKLWAVCAVDPSRLNVTVLQNGAHTLMEERDISWVVTCEVDFEDVALLLFVFGFLFRVDHDE